MVRTHKKQLGTRPYKNYTPEKLEEALLSIKQGRISLRKASKKYKIPQGTLSHKINFKHVQHPGHPLVFSKEEEDAFISHLEIVSKWGFPLNLTDLRLIAKCYLDKRGRKERRFNNNLPSTDWARNFLNRHTDKLRQRLCQNIKRSRARVGKDHVMEFLQNLKETLTDLPPSNVFNYDETNLSDDPGRKKCIFKRGVKYPERVKDSTKTAISIMFCGSATGKMLPAYVVYKAENLWSTWSENGPQGTRYNRSRSGWFDNTCFSDWFASVFVKCTKNIEGRKVIIGDNLSSHFSEDVLQLAAKNDITFVCLPPNSTHLLQPLDVAFYAPLKKYWRKVLDVWKSTCKKKSATLSKDQFPKLLKKLYEYIYPDGENFSNNLISGFAKTSIYPFNPETVLSRLPDVQPENDDSAAVVVSESLIDLLRKMRGTDEDNLSRQRKKRINVAPGKSISAEDFSAIPGTSNDMSDDENDCNIEEPENIEEAGDLEVEELSDAGSKEVMEFSAENIELVNIMIDSYYIIKFSVCAKSSYECYYIGKVVALSEDGCTVTFLRQSRQINAVFIWPQAKDESVVQMEQFVMKLSNPEPHRRGTLKLLASELKPFLSLLK